MAAEDWTDLSNSAASAHIARGVTSGIARPPGGENFVYGFNSKLVDPGTVGLRTNETNFDPTPANKNGTVSAAIKRGISGGTTDFAPFIFIALQGPAVADNGYVLGLGDSEPAHIVLAKMALTSMLEDLTPDPTVNGILLRSTASYTRDTWLHLRLDAITQGSGDVLLQCYASDLDTYDVDSPSWVVIPGMEGDQHPTITGFVDDALGVATGSAPYTNGRIGFGFRSENSTRRSWFDYVVIGRQL